MYTRRRGSCTNVPPQRRDCPTCSVWKLSHLDIALRRVWSDRVQFACYMLIVIRGRMSRMTMLSFRVPDEDAAEVQRWADALGIDRSEFLRDALHRHLVVLNAEADAQRWEEQPATETERSFEAIADWGPAEDWSDWANAEG